MFYYSLLFAIAFLFGQAYSESVHWQWRELNCKGGTKGGATQCEISLRESETDENSRIASINPCIEDSKTGKPRSYCNVLCPGADTVYLIKRTPNNHRSCFGHFSYKIEKRNDDFYLWRDGKCRSSEVSFTIRCEFAFGRKGFPTDQELVQATKKLLAA